MLVRLRRLLRHLFAPSARRLYPAESLQRIAAAVAAGESSHRGEVCFAVESALPIVAVLQGHEAGSRAQEIFARLRVWDTAENNGVLLYLLLADHHIEIVADRGLDGRIGVDAWREICRQMEARLKAGDAEAAVTAAIAAVSALLAQHFPRIDGAEDSNELPDLPRILG